MSSRTRRGDRRADQMVVAALVTRGTTLLRILGTNQMIAPAITSTAAAISTTDTMLDTGISPVWMSVGDIASAMKKMTVYVVMLAVVERTAPDATADARSTPCF